MENIDKFEITFATQRDDKILFFEKVLGDFRSKDAIRTLSEYKKKDSQLRVLNAYIEKFHKMYGENVEWQKLISIRDTL